MGLCPAKSLFEPRLVSRLVLRPLLDRRWVNWGQWEGLASPVSLFGRWGHLLPATPVDQSTGGSYGVTPPAVVPCQGLAGEEKEMIAEGLYPGGG